ncbi:sensor histidine kinase [Lachnoclostridium sp. Marseille-P6806]|uniref:sensor histidine kinase n=1 Tax=Lachnoclostridium sp. Marseille-P6806 TaxID=2364793 RepID=UPI0013EF48A5|nr:HAMP domain-containing sensor histidine kinase [Lachnoclostridium sp. Marseille-P6806]
MFYFILIILVLVLFFMTRKDKKASDKYLSRALAAFTMAIIALVAYIARDAYYYNVVNNYFSLPQGIWKALMFAAVPRGWLIRWLNASALLVIYLFVQFSLTFLSDAAVWNNRRFRRQLVLFLGIQCLFYDPQVQETLYLLLYPKVLDAPMFGETGKIIHMVTCILNCGLIIDAVRRVFWINCKVAPAYFFRYYAWGESLCFACIAIAYLFIFWFAPMSFVKVSRLAGFVSYRSVPLSGSNLVYRFYPYYLVLATFVIIYFLGHSIVNRRKLERNELNIRRQIDAADTTSKTFCHYMKNELLAIQAEVEMLNVGEAEEEDKKEILERCDNLYRRLDEIHHSTKMSELILKRTDICCLMDEILEHMAPDFKDCEIRTEYGKKIPAVMVDSAYFDQAVHNILMNAREAMEKCPDRNSILNVRIYSIDNWVQISITDNGAGISAVNMNKIFTPFYSSAPIKKHWGIGLGLTYKIITTHGGRIEVESTEHEETTFRIVLPSILQNAGTAEEGEI